MHQIQKNAAHLQSAFHKICTALVYEYHNYRPPQPQLMYKLHKITTKNAKITNNNLVEHKRSKL